MRCKHCGEELFDEPSFVIDRGNHPKSLKRKIIEGFGKCVGEYIDKKWGEAICDPLDDPDRYHEPAD